MQLKNIIMSMLDANDSDGIQIRRNLMAGKYESSLVKLLPEDAARLKLKAETDLYLLDFKDEESDESGGGRSKTMKMK